MLKLVLICTAVVTMLMVNPVIAQQKDGNLKQQIVGTWSLVSQYVDQGGGEKTERYGFKPRGMAIYQSNGKFVQVMLHTTLPKIASNNIMTGTADENKAIVQGSMASFGKYTVNDKEGTLVSHIDASSYPNWDGEDQKRKVSISGDEMKIIIPNAAVGGTAYLVWKRFK